MELEIDAREVLPGDEILFNGGPWKVASHVGRVIVGEDGNWVFDHGFSPPKRPLVITVRRA